MNYTIGSVRALVNTVRNLYAELMDGIAEEYASEIVNDNVCLTAEQARGFGLTDIADDIENAKEGDIQ